MPRIRILGLLSLIAVAPVGLGLKFYRGPGQSFVNDWSSSLAYECFWMLAMISALPTISHKGAVTKL